MIAIVREMYASFVDQAAKDARRSIHTFLLAGLDRGQVRAIMLAMLRDQAATMGDYGPDFVATVTPAIDRAIEIEFAELN